MKNYQTTGNILNHVTEFREANVNIGANVYISVEDAKGLLAMTDMRMAEDEHERQMMFEKSRNFARLIAKAVLYSGGDATSEDELLGKFSLENLMKNS